MRGQHLNRVIECPGPEIQAVAPKAATANSTRDAEFCRSFLYELLALYSGTGTWFSRDLCLSAKRHPELAEGLGRSRNALVPNCLKNKGLNRKGRRGRKDLGARQ